jgi:hypothetical protein
MTPGDFRFLLLELIERARITLPAAEIWATLEDATNSCRGEMIHDQLEHGTWPPADPAHKRIPDASR